MALSKDLISQFAKITKDSSNKNTTKSEKTVFGTVVEYEGKTYVRLDGSERLTPVTSTTNVVDSERVTVMIKDHSAIITGNITSPTARGEDVDNAGRSATNFMYHDSVNGLQIGDRRTGTWKGFRSQLTSSAFNILSETGTLLASYGQKLIELGKNATDAVIKFCGGKGQIEYVTDESRSYFQVKSDNVRLKGDNMASVYSTYTDNSSRWEKSAVNVSTTRVEAYASECIEPSLNDMLEGWNTSEVVIDPDAVRVTTPGAVTFDAAYLQDNFGRFVSYVEGTSGIWTYRKWSNGKVELWGSYSVSNKACSTALGNMYRTDVFSVGSFPFSVYNAKLTASYESAGYGGFLWATSLTSSTSPPSYYLIRPTSATIASGKIILHVTGTW